MKNQQYYGQKKRQLGQIAQKMRNGSNISQILNAEGSKTHYLDSLERFQKDFASYDKQRREQEKIKRQGEIQKKRLMYLERQNKRWEQNQNLLKKQKQKQHSRIEQHNLGIRKNINTNSLAYNPITMAYDKNPEGQKLRYRDEENKIRGYVRAHNMDYHGNSKYNPLNGGDRVGIQSIIPNQLQGRYIQKKRDHYQHLKISVPSTPCSSSQVPRKNYNINKCL